MPGLPAAGGWGGSNRTLGITMEGFTEEEIAKAVDHCDNDRIRVIKYLTALKNKGGGHNWKKAIESKLPTLDAQMRGLAQRLLAYDNVPIKQKPFVNFAKNSLALQRQPQLAEKLWEAVGELIRPPPKAPQETAQKKEEKEEEKEKEEKKKKEKNEDGEEEVKKKKKKSKETEEEEEEEDSEKKKKKKKKSKEATAEEEEEESEKKKKKKSKEEDKEEEGEGEGEKKKKKKKENKDAEAEEEAEENEKKKKKKKSKEEDKDEMEVEAEEEKSDEDKKKKKKKKDKSEKPEEEDEISKHTRSHDEGGSDKMKKKKDRENKAMDVDEELDDKASKKEKKRAAEDDESNAKKHKKSDGTASKASSQFNFYTESEAVRKAGEKETEQWRAESNVKVTDCDLHPILKFADAPFDEKLMESCKSFAKPSVIQAQCWPVCLSGRDLVGIAETGSGKTLAFGMPGLTHIMKLNLVQSKSPVMLVLAPTRELAMQVAVVLEKAGEPVGISTVCVYGGVPKHEQKAALKKGVQVLVATPGRLLDLMQENCCSVSKVSYLVLDEADRMLDLGFEKDIRTIIAASRPDRQTVMFSATWPQSIQAIAAEFQKHPARVTVGSEELSANHRVKQIVQVVEPQDKDKHLVSMLKKYHDKKNRIIIFVLYKKEADRVNAVVEKQGYKVLAIHGDRSQEQRSAAVEKFKKGEVPLLIATDVAARGLDIPGVEYVINYTFPLTTEDYVHRIGRTGRAGKMGVSHTLFTQHDKLRAGELVNVLREANQEVPEDLLKFGTHVKKKEHKLFGAHFKDVDMNLKATKKTFGDSDDDE